MPESVTLGIRLKALREFYGWSQRELAKRAGVPNSAISMIEQGAVSPTVQSLEKVLKGFPIKLKDFFLIDLRPSSEKVTHALDTEHAQTLSATFMSSTGGGEGWSVRYFKRQSDEDPVNTLSCGKTLIFLLEGQVMYRSISGDHILNRGSSLSIADATPFRIEPLQGDAAWVIATSPK